jgi:hypothetical protein
MLCKQFLLEDCRREKGLLSWVAWWHVLACSRGWWQLVAAGGMIYEELFISFWSLPGGEKGAGD